MENIVWNLREDVIDLTQIFLEPRSPKRLIEKPIELNVVLELHSVLSFLLLHQLVYSSLEFFVDLGHVAWLCTGLVACFREARLIVRQFVCQLLLGLAREGPSISFVVRWPFFTLLGAGNFEDRRLRYAERFSHCISKGFTDQLLEFQRKATYCRSHFAMHRGDRVV